MTLPLRFGKKVRSRKTFLHVSQDELAARCGLHRTYIGAVERGERNITLVNAEKIANALEVKLSDLLQDD